jgi:hypothetical protein
MGTTRHRRVFKSALFLFGRPRYIAGMLWRNSRGRPLNAPAAFTHLCQPIVAKHACKMKANELFRNVPANIHELHLVLAGLPEKMKVKAHSDTGLSEKTVDELRARTAWPAGLVITTPRELYPKSIVKISKAVENRKS